MSETDSLCVLIDNINAITAEKVVRCNNCNRERFKVSSVFIFNHIGIMSVNGRCRCGCRRFDFKLIKEEG